VQAKTRVVTMRLSAKAFREIIGPTEAAALRAFLAERERETGISTTSMLKGEKHDPKKANKSKANGQAGRGSLSKGARGGGSAGGIMGSMAALAGGAGGASGRPSSPTIDELIARAEAIERRINLPTDILIEVGDRVDEIEAELRARTGANEEVRQAIEILTVAEGAPEGTAGMACEKLYAMGLRLKTEAATRAKSEGAVDVKVLRYVFQAVNQRYAKAEGLEPI